MKIMSDQASNGTTPNASPPSPAAQCSATDAQLIVAFLQGAKWWEYVSRGATMWNTDQQKAVGKAQSLLRDGNLGRESPNAKLTDRNAT